jgi:ribosome-associated protein
MSDTADQRDPQPQGGRIDLGHGAAVPESALRLQYSRSSGPGGQNVNKVNTRAQLWVAMSAITGLRESAVARLRRLAGQRITIADELHLVAETERTQEGNRGAVLDRLRLLIAEAVKEPKRRKKTKPSRGSKERRLKGKKVRGEIKSKRRFRPEG